jgi:DNA-binding MarR family transcriptional regulator
MSGSELLEFALDLARRARLLLEADGLTIRQYHALRALAPAPLRVGELARLLEIRTPSTVTLVDGLVARGLARREPDAGDGRVSLVGLTSSGRRVLGQAERRLVEAFDELAASAELATR